ncbi:MAG: hypothetical protein V1690_03845 [Candidatus Moraniibacteriota bacterium]
MRLNTDYHGSQLIIPLYEGKFLQTCWSAKNIHNSLNGWTLVSGLWAPWYINLRRLGSEPYLYERVVRAMAELIVDHPDIDALAGVEMAGISMASAAPIVLLHRYGRAIKNGYTRPLPRKPKKVEEVIPILKEFGPNVADYGEKGYVELDFDPGDRVAILDDMATTLGSKLIRRSVVLYEAERRGVEISCDNILYFLNRGSENKQTGLDFAKKTDPELYPAPLNVSYVVEFDEQLPQLKKVMRESEFEVISRFQKNRDHFQDKAVRKEVLAQVAKDLGLPA